MQPIKSLDQVCSRTKSGKIRRRYPARPLTERTEIDPTDGLAKYQFPLMLSESAKCYQNWEQKEREFFNSLSFLANLYQFTPYDRYEALYPMNVYNAWQAAAKLVKRVDENTALFILEDNNHLATLATYLSMPLDIDHYYASLQPFDRLLRAKDRRNQVNLMASVFAYLANIHKIPFFQDDYSYSGDYYQLIVDDGYWNEPKEQARIAAEIHTASKRAKKIKNLLKNSRHLSLFQQRLTRFTPETQLDRDLLKAGELAERLYSRYPQRSIFGSIPGGFVDMDYEDEESQPPLSPDQYLQFIWTKFDDLGECIVRWLENDSQELMYIDEPMNWQIFDSPQPAITLTLDFEKDFFDMYFKFLIYLNNIE